MNKVKLKEYNLDETSGRKRVDYIYDQFCIDKSEITCEDFIDLINKYYYKYAGDLYGFHYDLEGYYRDVFKDIPDGYQIIDIGAGTGFSYKLINKIGYSYSKYHFIEPSKEMSDKLLTEHSKDNNLLIVNDYIENCWGNLSEDGDKKIFIMNAAFHHIVNLKDFSLKLKESMNYGDFFFMPYEPNNNYEESLLSYIYGFINAVKRPKLLLFRVAKSIIPTFIFLKLKKKFKNKSSDFYLTKALNDLISSNIVRSDFTEQMIYAITDYGVYKNWDYISVPDSFNEGFYTLNKIDDILGLQRFYFQTYTYQYPKELKINRLLQFIDNGFRILFPKSGANICMCYIKK